MIERPVSCCPLAEDTNSPLVQAKMEAVDIMRHRKAAERAARGEDIAEEVARMKQEEVSHPGLRIARQRDVEEFDEVKDFNMRANQARVLRERQAQLVEAVRKREEAQAREAAWAEIAERDRRRALEEQREAEARKREARRRAAEDIREQLRVRKR